jgi:hypothetical protein
MDKLALTQKCIVFQDKLCCQLMDHCLYDCLPVCTCMEESVLLLITRTQLYVCGTFNLIYIMFTQIALQNY